MRDRWRHILFWTAVALQVLIIAAVPARKILARATGRTVLLRVEPVDPFDPLAGYYMALNCEIARPRVFPDPPVIGKDEVVFAVVEERGDAWRPVELALTWPEDPAPGRVVLRGTMGANDRIEYGIERFYVPETARGIIEDDLRGHIESVRLEVRVGADGRAALVAIRVQDRIYR